jgi:large conductance mechanosensitive channel
MGLLTEFREFAMRGNVIDLAVGVIIGASFGKITNSLVNDIIMPPIGLMLGGVKFDELFVNLSDATLTQQALAKTPGAEVLTLAIAKAGGLATINYGTFISTVIDFIILAFAVFMMIKIMNNLAKKTAGIEIAKAKA